MEELKEETKKAIEESSKLVDDWFDFRKNINNEEIIKETDSEFFILFKKLEKLKYLSTLDEKTFKKDWEKDFEKIFNKNKGKQND